ncbi:hypothetical protein Tco_0872400 [Tanacetum coccineum]
MCKEDVLLNNNIGKQSGDLVEMPSEAVEQGMDDHVPDEIDGAKCEQVPNHVVNKGSLEDILSSKRLKTQVFYTLREKKIKEDNTKSKNQAKYAALLRKYTALQDEVNEG